MERDGVFPHQVKLSEIKSKSAVAVVNNDTENVRDVMQQWLNNQCAGRLIVQEKVDGSNFTVFRDPSTLELAFFNKGKLLTLEKQSNSTFARTCEILRTRQDLFRPGYIYHGEAMRAARANHIMYRRIPKYHWMCYEIMVPLADGTYVHATPHEMTEILAGTGIEQVHMYYDSMRAADDLDASLDRLAGIFLNVDALHSSLGNVAEGFVVKVLTAQRKGKTVPYRAKYVSKHMRERKVVEGMISPDYTLEAIGDVFNTAARHRKALQHLQERGEEVTYAALVREADADLLIEHGQEIADMLMQRYFPVIRKAARKDLPANLGIETKRK